MIVMMPVVAVHSVPIIPVVGWTGVVVASVIPVRITSVIAIRISIVAGIAVAVSRVTESNSNSTDPDGNLSIRFLCRNQSQSDRHQCNQKNLFHNFSLLLVSLSCLLFCEG